jgi:DNA-binding transcriptional regulator YiaG
MSASTPAKPILTHLTDKMGFCHALAIEQLHWPQIIRQFRKRYKLTQTKLASLLPTTSKRNVQDWEQGCHKPPTYLKRALRDLARELEQAKKKD